jgi:two-component system LytT family sensor kinase
VETVKWETFLGRRWVRWTAVFLVWTAVGLFFASQASMWDRFLFRQQVPWQRALSTNLTFYYIWAVLTPFVIWIGKRFRLEKKQWGKSLAVHFPISIALAVLQLIAAEALWGMMRDEPLSLYETFRAIEFSFAFNFHINFLTYWVILAFSYMIDYYRLVRDRELRASVLEAQLTKANLRALKMQLQPHFLFNTLNAISSLMHKNIADADRVVARLGDLLRYSLDSGGVQEVSLAEELDFLRRYLEIEQIRFGERLTVKINAERETLQAKVPNLILQPLVENAIRYGIGNRAKGGAIEISAQRDEDSLILAVKDDGPGLSHNGNGGFEEGVGLRNTRARLEQLYGDQQEFHLFNGDRRGLEVRLKIPYHVVAIAGI